MEEEYGQSTAKPNENPSNSFINYLPVSQQIFTPIQSGQVYQLIRTADGQTYVCQPVVVADLGGLGQQQQQQLNQPAQSGLSNFAIPTVSASPSFAIAYTTDSINVPQTSSSSSIAGQRQQQVKPKQVEDDDVLYVNAKQYHRIMKRREARAKLEAAGRIPKERQKYLHESRHQHALNRTRNKGGMFAAGSVKKGRKRKAADAPAPATATAAPEFKTPQSPEPMEPKSEDMI